MSPKAGSQSGTATLQSTTNPCPSGIKQHAAIICMISDVRQETGRAQPGRCRQQERAGQRTTTAKLPHWAECDILHCTLQCNSSQLDCQECTIRSHYTLIMLSSRGQNRGMHICSQIINQIKGRRLANIQGMLPAVPSSRGGSPMGPQDQAKPAMKMQMTATTPAETL